MGTSVLNRSWFSSIILYSTLTWTVICFVGTWVVILKYGIFLSGFIATAMTLFFALIIWAVPLMGFLISDLCLTPAEPSPPSMMFKDLVRKGMGEVKEAQ